MRLLIVVARPPRYDGKGDQLRAAHIVRALSERHDVVVLSPRRRRGEQVDVPDAVRLREVGLSRPERALSLFAGALSGAPGQLGWFRPRRLRRAIRRMAADRDLVLFVTARTWVPGLARPYVVDHIDALGFNAERRGAAQRFAGLRALWRLEARRMRALERRAAAGAAGQVVCSPVDADELPQAPVPVVIPPPLVTSRATPAGSNGARDIDVVFTGNMRYPPNRRAAVCLTQEIAPLIRARRDARIVVVGRDAGTLPASPLVEHVADVPSIAPYLQRSKVLAAAIEGGTGVPSKVLDAALAGAAIALTPEANAALGFSAGAVAVASTPREFADELVGLLDDDDRRSASVATLQRELRRFDMASFTQAYERVLATAGGDDAR